MIVEQNDRSHANLFVLYLFIAQVEGEYQEALKRSQRCLNTVNSFSDDQVPNKIEVTANLHSCIGNAYLEMGQYDKSLEHHNIDLAMGEEK